MGIVPYKRIYYIGYKIPVGRGLAPAAAVIPTPLHNPQKMLNPIDRVCIVWYFLIQSLEERVCGYAGVCGQCGHHQNE